jgi:hypothetical protein
MTEKGLMLKRVQHDTVDDFDNDTRRSPRKTDAGWEHPA